MYSPPVARTSAGGIEETRTMTTNAMDVLTASLTSAIKKCIADGFATPLHVVLVASNGTMRFYRFASATAGSKLAEYTADGALPAPINLVVFDSGGRVARLLIEGSGSRWVH